MSAEVRELVVFVASPGDLTDERNTVPRAAESVNASIGSKFGIRLHVTGWEQVQPEFGRPQGLINPLVEECDIFIGLFNRRWGSSTGIYSSGFEEEFEHAIARRARNELPRIGIFFKKIPDDVLSDPGKEVSKVITFRNRLHAEHLALYKQFDGPADLERLLVDLLADHVAQIAKQMLPHSPEGTMSIGAPVLPDPARSINSAREQIGNTLSAFVGLVQLDSHDGPLDGDRLLLFALAIHRDSHLLPAHFANRLYRQRDQLHLALAEYVLWLRTIAADNATAHSTGWSRVIPGWQVIVGDSDFIDELAERLAGLAADDDARVSGGALILLRQLRLRPLSLWAQHNAEPSSSETEDIQPAAEALSLVDSWVNILEDNGASESAFAYIATLATGRDLWLLDSLTARLGGTSASIELRAIRDDTAGDPGTLARLAAGKYSIPAWQEEAVQESIGNLTSDVLDQLVIGRHKSKNLRSAALEEAGRRGTLSSTMLIAALTNEDANLSQMAFHYASKTDAGILTEVISDLEKDSGNAEWIPRLLAMTTSPDVLRASMTEPIGNIRAWEALTWQAGEQLADEAREILKTNASTLIAPVADLPLPDKYKGVVDYLRERACRAAVNLLARLPESFREVADVELIRAELARDRWATKTEAALSLGAVGGSEDVPALLDAMTTAYPANARETLLDAAIRLGGVDTARALAAGDDMCNALAGTRALAGMTEVQDSELVDLLYCKHAPVRLAALTGLRVRWDDKRLSVLLREYGSSPTTYYYYNVIAELDRIIYAPAEIANLPIVVPMA